MLPAMSDDAKRPQIYLIRHGETEWSKSGKHTGRTDLPLTDAGRANAEKLRPALAACDFKLVLVSPLRRARQTCDLAGFGGAAVVDDDLVEWDYGEYEGLTTEEIHEKNPTWNVFDDGAPGGETPADVTARVDRAVARAAAADGDAAVFAHGHLLRCLAARWVDQPVRFGNNLLLDTGTVSVLGHYHDHRAIRSWNGPALPPGGGRKSI